MRICSVLILSFFILLFLPSQSHGAEAAKSLYASRCQGCHGPDGKGNQAMAKALQANIPDLTSKEIAKKPNAEILEALSKGKGKMPATTGLSEKELKELIGYVKGMAKGK
jgi:mono/diheme cytochrome c family protein